MAAAPVDANRAPVRPHVKVRKIGRLINPAGCALRNARPAPNGKDIKERETTPAGLRQNDDEEQIKYDE